MKLCLLFLLSSLTLGAFAQELETKLREVMAEVLPK